MISVIIPHANSVESLYRLLSSVQKQVVSELFEVVVVINPEDRYANFPEWRFSFPLIWEWSPAGANRARQKGVQSSRGEILIFLDDDCEILDPYFFQKHIQHHHTAGLSGVGGRYRLYGRQSLFGRVYNKLQNDWLQSHRLPGGFNMHLLGGNSSFKREIFAEESYDENIVFGGTETELQVRLHQRKRKLKLFEDIQIEHDGQLGFRDFLTKSFKQGIGAAYISERHQRPPKYLFAKEASIDYGRIFKMTEWLYKVSFEAGRKHYQDTHELKVPRKTIYKKISRMIPHKIFAKDFFLWREGRTLSLVISKGLLISSRKSESHLPRQRDEGRRTL